MKTIKFTIIAFIAVLSLASCKKDSVEKTTAEKIMGKWNVSSIITTEEEPSKPEKTSTKIGEVGAYIDFRSDGKMHTRLDGDFVDEYSYTVDSDTQITFDGMVAKILVLKDHEFSFELKTEESGITITSRFNLTR